MDLGNTNGLSMTSNVPITINMDGMEMLIQDVNKASMKLNENFNQINNIMAGTKDFYKSESGNNIRRQFEDYYINLSNIVQSIENYAYSLKNVRDNFTSITESSGRRLSEAIDGIASIVPKK